MFFGKEDRDVLSQAFWRTWETIAADLIQSIHECEGEDAEPMCSESVRECVLEHVDSYGDLSPAMMQLVHNRESRKYVDEVLASTFPNGQTWE